TPVQAQGTLLRNPPVAIGKGDSKRLERRGPEEREATHRLAAYLICALLPALLKGNGSEGQRASARPRLVGVHVLVKQVRAITPAVLGEQAACLWRKRRAAGNASKGSCSTMRVIRAAQARACCSQ